MIVCDAIIHFNSKEWIRVLRNLDTIKQIERIVTRHNGWVEILSREEAK